MQSKTLSQTLTIDMPLRNNICQDRRTRTGNLIELVDSHPRTFQLCKSFSINHGDCYNDSFVNEGNIFHFHITVLS